MAEVDGRHMTLEDISSLKEEKLMELKLSQKRLKESLTTFLVCPEKEQNVAENKLMMDFSALISLIQSIGVTVKFIRKCKKMFVSG